MNLVHHHPTICSTEAEFLDVIRSEVLRDIFLLIYSQSPLLTDINPPPPPHLSKSGLKPVCNVNIVCGNLKSENFQDFAQKPQRNCFFMNLASVVEQKTERFECLYICWQYM